MTRAGIVERCHMQCQYISDVVLVSLLLPLNRFLIFCGVFIVDFKQVMLGGELSNCSCSQVFYRIIDQKFVTNSKGKPFGCRPVTSLK